MLQPACCKEGGKIVVLLEITGLRKTFGEKQVLRDINLEVERGEIFAMMGPSGTGKTTLLRILDLLEKPDTGHIKLDGMVINGGQNNNRTAARQRISMVFQSPALFNDTVYNNVAYSLKVRGMDKHTIEHKVSQSLALVGLEGYGNRKAKTLSGGEEQRIAFARAVVFGPDLLLLDEPTANLDPANVAKIEEVIRTINRELDTTIIIATHHMNQVRRLADRVGMLLEGELIESGRVEDVFAGAADDRTRAFIEGEMVC
ncbi:MAG: ATP-binding cassette domain-containing protein [Methanosarcinales archaeon]|nr:ATP-binding cassette domain-containing protein [Methanosarcinales archaeon]